MAMTTRRHRIHSKSPGPNAAGSSHADRGCPARAAWRSLFVAVLLISIQPPPPTRAAQNLPNGADAVRRMVARAQFVAREGQTNNYTYHKRAVTAELNDKEQVVKSTEKLYRVVLIGGLPFPRLVKVQGRELSESELQKRNQRETEFRQRVTRVNMKEKAGRREGLVTQDLADRFEFRVVRREIVEGRATLEIAFSPRPDAPDMTMEDKIFKRVFGTLWMDEEDAELARLDAGVRGPIPLGWFGAIGSLHKFQATIERSRLSDGIWVNRKSTFWIVARKFMSMIRSKTIEEASGFQREERGN